MLELDAFKKLLPELLAIGLKFNMKPTAYYKENEYRVFYHNETEAFINLDMMIRFAAPGIAPQDTQKVSFLVISSGPIQFSQDFFLIVFNNYFIAGLGSLHERTSQAA